MDRPPTATVFIGNIPYDVSEQMLMDMFSQAGPIKSLRMVNDKDTGKPKGYGFCEFHDVQTAQSAVRNLNKFEVNGRMLRVDYADEHQPDVRGKRDKEPRGAGPRGGAQEQSVVPGPPPGTRPIGRDMAGAAATQMNALLGNAAYTGVSQDRISTVIAGMTPLQLFEILSQMRTLCQQNQAAARSILVGNPQLTKALFQAQVLLGMVKGSAPPPSSIAAALAAPSAQPGPQSVGAPVPPGGPPLAPPPHNMMPPGGAPGQPAPSMPPPQFAVATGPGGAYLAPGGPQGAPQTLVVGGMPGPMLIDPSTGLPYTAPPGAVIVPTGQAPPQPTIIQAPAPQQPPPAPAPLPVAPPPEPAPPVAPPQPAAPPAPAPAPAPAAPAAGGQPATVQLPSNLAPQQAQVLQQVLSLTPAQIDALPPAQRQQVLLVRQQLGLGAPAVPPQ